MRTSPRLIAFDLDDTLAPSKTRLPDEMVTLLTRLLEDVEVAVISGGNYEQFTSQLIEPLSEAIDDAAENPEMLGRLHLLPTCGTRYYRFEAQGWQPLYIENLTQYEREGALEALEHEARNLDLWEQETWGPILEDRGSQITFSALGQRAPVEAKQAWDPTGDKKNRLRDAVAARLPDLEVRSGGSTSVDITRRGIDKAYGMAKLAEATGIDYDEMLFIGDRLDPSGNDFPVKRLGIPTHAVTGWQDTAGFLRGYLAESRAS